MCNECSAALTWLQTVTKAVTGCKITGRGTPLLNVSGRRALRWHCMKNQHATVMNVAYIYKMRPSCNFVR